MKKSNRSCASEPAWTTSDLIFLMELNPFLNFPQDIWTTIFQLLDEKSIFCFGSASHLLNDLMVKEIEKRYEFWFGKPTTNTSIAQDYIKLSSYTIYSKKIKVNNPNSPFFLNPCAFTPDTHISYKGRITHMFDMDTFSMLISDIKSLSHFDVEEDDIQYFSPTQENIATLFRSGVHIPLSESLIKSLLPIFPTGEYLIFKMKMSISFSQNGVNLDKGYPNYYTKSTSNVFYESSGSTIYIHPLFTNHIDNNVVDEYAKRMMVSNYEPTILLFGTTGPHSTVFWIVDGHHKAFAAARTGIFHFC